MHLRALMFQKIIDEDNSKPNLRALSEASSIFHIIIV